MITAKIESVKTARLENGWNMYELARHAEVTMQTIARIERGGCCTVATAKSVADAFGIDAVFVKTAHGGEILPVLIRLEQLLNAGFNAICNFLHSSLALLGIALIFSHKYTLLYDKNAPLHRRFNHPEQGRNRKSNCVFGVLDSNTLTAANQLSESLMAQGFLRATFSTVYPLFRCAHARFFCRILFAAQTAQ